MCRNFSRDIVYGTFQFQGLNITNPYIWQYLLHLHTMIQEGSRTTITGSLIHSTIEQLRLEAGFNGALTTIPEDVFKLLTARTWIGETLLFLKELQMDLQDPVGSFQLLREHDKVLMMAFYAQGYRGHQLYMLNVCRLRCQALTLTDIVTADGKYIRKKSWNCHPDYISSFTRDWPRSPTVLPTDWISHWQHALIRTFNGQEMRGTMKLHQPLHDWIGPHPKDWNLKLHNNTLYLRSDDKWKVYESTGAQRRNNKFRATNTYSTPPTDSHLATGDIQGELLFCTGSMQCWDKPIENPRDMFHARRQLPSNARWAIDQLVLATNPDLILQALQNNKAIMVSDGSYKEGFGTSAFSFGTFEDHCIGVNLVPGDTQDHTPHRAELAGIIGGLTALKMFCHVYKVSSGSVTIGLDGDNAMKRAAANSIDADWADWDLISVIHYLKKELPITCNWRWIEGHQDDHMEFFDLDKWAQMNVIMDYTAKQYWQHCYRLKKKPFMQPLYGETWTVHWNRRKLTKIVPKEIYEEHHSDVTRDRWIKYGQLHLDNVHSPDWEALGKVMKYLPFQRRIWLAKQLTGMTGVNHWMKIWKKSTTDACPRCLTPDETSLHVLKCPDERAKEQWQNSLGILELHLERLDTPRIIITTIIEQLHAWRDPHYRMQGAQHAVLVETQTFIGWQNLLFGRLTPQWQQIYSLTHPSEKDVKSKRWVSQLIKKLLDVAWDMWEHRNGIAHDINHPWRQEERRQTEAEIKDQFNIGTSTLKTQDRYYLESLEAVLQYDHATQQQWLSSVKAARSAFADSQIVPQERPNQLVEGMRAGMTNWLRGNPSGN